MSKNNPKEFWKLLNKGKGKKQPNNEIDKLYDLIISSSPQAFSFFNFCIHFKISSFEI
jgi:hypothetical protein